VEFLHEPFVGRHDDTQAIQMTEEAEGHQKKHDSPTDPGGLRGRTRGFRVGRGAHEQSRIEDRGSRIENARRSSRQSILDPPSSMTFVAAKRVIGQSKVISEQ
jgi:hypothetical protein